MPEPSTPSREDTLSLGECDLHVGQRRPQTMRAGERLPVSEARATASSISGDSEGHVTRYGLPVAVAQRLGEAMACIAYGRPLPEWYREV